MADRKTVWDFAIKKDSSFYMVKGLADSAGVSFKSYNYPDRYLRHRGFKLFLDVKETNQTYLNDATFYKEEVPSNYSSRDWIATAVAGAVFLPAVPVIVAGGAIGGGAGSGISKSAETQARESILADCLNERGYKAYKTK
jgi:hypothetical protein